MNKGKQQLLMARHKTRKTTSQQRNTYMNRKKSPFPSKIPHVLNHLPALLCLLAVSLVTANADDATAMKASGPTFTRNRPDLAVSPAPFTTNGIPDLVPASWIIEAVRQKAADRWPVFAIGKPIPCSDRAGKLVGYQVPVAIRTNHFPDLLTPPPASEITRNDLQTRQLWESTNYWTFFVSARQSLYPVPQYGEGLPPFLVTYHKAVELAKAQLGSADVQLAHYYALGPFGSHYDFVGNSKRILVDARNLRDREVALGEDSFANPNGTVANNVVTNSPEANEILRRDYERRSSEAWAKISSNNQEKGN
jgi:hypothetical protein